MEATGERILESTRQISRLYHDRVNVKQAIKLMRGQSIIPDLVKTVYNQLSWNDEKLMIERFHYYTIETEPYSPYRNFSCWTSRYLFAYRNQPVNSAFHNITIFDLFNNKLIKITVEKSAERFDIHYLKDGFGLLEEHGNRNSFLSLIFLDLSQQTFKKIHTVEHRSISSKIVVDKADLTTFLLTYYIGGERVSRICKIVEKTIIIGEVVDTSVHPDSFYDKYVYFFKRYDQNGRESIIPQIHIYNLEEKAKNHFNLEAPSGYKLNKKNTKWIRGNLFIDLISRNKRHFISCLNAQTRQWNVFDLSLQLSDYRITGFGEGNLIIRTESKHYSEHSFYKISFGNPELLENMAWLSLIKAMKKYDTIKDPYKAARKYLPSSSTINCPFDGSDKDEPKKKRKKLK